MPRARRLKAACLLVAFLCGGVALPAWHRIEHAFDVEDIRQAIARQANHSHADEPAWTHPVLQLDHDEVVCVLCKTSNLTAYLLDRAGVVHEHRPAQAGLQDERLTESHRQYRPIRAPPLS